MPDRTDPMTIVETIEQIAAGVATVQAQLDADLAKGLNVQQLRIAAAGLAAVRSRLAYHLSWGEKADQDEVLKTLGTLLEVEGQVKAVAAGCPGKIGRSSRRRR